MHTDKKNGYSNDDLLPDVDEAAQEETLRWLLELDRSEPEEKLFTLGDHAVAELELTDYERAVAHRPLSRGRAGADDLSAYVEEEIVISSETQGSSDIYGNAAQSSSAAQPVAAAEEIMAIDYSLGADGEHSHPGAGAFDGADLLGLSDDDDIGEKYLVIKRLKTGPDSRAGCPETDGRTSERGEPAGSAAEASPAPAPTVDGASRGGQPVLRLVPLEGEAADTDPADDMGAPALDMGEDLESLFSGTCTDPSAAAGESAGADGFAPQVEAGGLGEDIFAEDIFAEEFTAAIGSVDGFEEVPGSPDDEIAAFFDGFTGVPVGGASAGEAAPTDADRDGFAPIDFQTESEGVALEAGLPADVLPQSGAPDPGAGSLADVLPDSAFDEFAIGGVDAGPVFFDFDVDSAAVGDIPAGSGVPDFEAAPPEERVPFAAELEIGDDPLFEAGFAALEMETPDFDAELPELPVDASAAAEPVASGDASDPHLDATGPDAAEAVARPVAAAAAGAEEPTAAEAEAAPMAAGERWYLPANVAFNHTSRGSSEIFADFLDAFVEEGSTELEKLEDAIARWEKEPGSEAAFAPVARTLHTMKGIAKGVGLQFYGTLIHNFETLLEALPRPRAEDAADYFRIVNVWLDAAVRGLDHVQQHRTDILSEFPQPAGADVPEAPAVCAGQEPVPAAQAAGEAAATEPVSGEPVRPDANRKQVARELADEGARVLAAQQSVRITSDKLDHLLNLANQARQLGVRTAQGSGRNRRTAEEMQGRLVSVRNQIAGIADRALRTVTARGGQATSELDALEMDQYSELQEAANILREGVEDLTDLVDSLSRQNAQVEALLKQQANVISSIGSAIRAARVVPVSRLGPGLRRLVRTLSADLDKAVNLQVLNEVGTLDRDDFARCQTILDHMVRNALDHGIESAAERAAAGKPAAGRITLDIRQVGADALITLTDDGRGIDPARMRESARGKGLDLDPDSLSDDEAIRLIFHKGFSTARTLSEISGRGVGMDIVVSELQQMGGDIRIESRVGEGTAFHIRIPSTVTVNGALLVNVGDQSYAIPLGGVFAVDNVEVEDFFTAVEQRSNLRVAGVDCEPAYLGTLCQGDSLPERKSWNGSIPVFVAGGPGRWMAIAVDDLEEAVELVIRSLGVQFASVPGVAGAATTADGRAIVALDLNLLVSTVDIDDHAPVYLDAERPETLLALVVDDSRTQRMVTTSQLETVGVETMTAEHGGVAIDLLNTAERLPDVVLLDVEMPVKDGIQTLREIRKSVRYGHIPVIMITSRTGLKHRSMAEAAGCNGYMGKPFNFRMLVAQISELTGHDLQLS